MTGASQLGLAYVGFPPPLTWVTAFTTWSIEAPLVVVGLLYALVLYLLAVRRVNAAHPASPVPPLRVAAWVAGLFVVFVALDSAIDFYSDDLFSVHMVQHLLLTMIAAALLTMGAPITLLLRAATREQRRRWILPVLESRLVRFISHPAFAWVFFAAVMWVSHFSVLYELSLEHPLIHAGEHLLYLGSAYLFWAPVVGADPSPHRLSYPLRVGYVFAQAPLNSFLSLAITQAPDVLYSHYANLHLPWGPGPLQDQHIAGGIMMTAGDLLLLAAILLVFLDWFRAEEVEGRRIDDVLAREQAALARATGRPADPTDRPPPGPGTP